MQNAQSMQPSPSSKATSEPVPFSGDEETNTFIRSTSAGTTTTSTAVNNAGSSEIDVAANSIITEESESDLNFSAGDGMKIESKRNNLAPSGPSRIAIGERSRSQMRSHYRQLVDTLRVGVSYNYTSNTTKITNFEDCCNALECAFYAREILAFVCEEIGGRGRFDVDWKPSIFGYHSETVIKEALLRLFRDFLMCEMCGHGMKRHSRHWYDFTVVCPRCFLRRHLKVTPVENDRAIF